MYSIHIQNRCLRELKRLDREIVRRAFRVIGETLAANPQATRAWHMLYACENDQPAAQRLLVGDHALTVSAVSRVPAVCRASSSVSTT